MQRDQDKTTDLGPLTSPVHARAGARFSGTGLRRASFGCHGHPTRLLEGAIAPLAQAEPMGKRTAPESDVVDLMEALKTSLEEEESGKKKAS